MLPVLVGIVRAFRTTRGPITALIGATADKPVLG